MATERRHLVISTAVAVLLGFFAAPGANGQTANPTGLQVQTFQNNISSLTGWLQSKAASLAAQSAVTKVQTQFAALTPDQVTLLASTFSLDDFNTAVTNLINVVPRPKAPIPSDPPSDLFPPDYGACTPGTSVFGPIPSDQATIGALDVAIGEADIAKDTGERFCDALAVAAGAGTNIPACIVANVLDAIDDALKTTETLLTFCDGNVSSAQIESAWRNTIVIDTDVTNLAHATTNQFASTGNQLTAMNADIVNHVNAANVDINNHIQAADVDLANRISSVDADVINKSTAVDTDLNNHLNSVDNDLLNRATQIDTEVSTFQTLAVRMQIEQALGAGVTIGLFEVPKVNGGYLETVRSIVNDTIGKLIASGQTVNAGAKYLSLGDTAFSGGQYKSAYANYMIAYQSAVK
jgi:hypothetical protein